MWAEIDSLSFKSKNLYNLANYYIRQAFIKDGEFLSYSHMAGLLKHQDTYKALPSKISQQVLRKLEKNWKSFFLAVKSYTLDPSKFRGRPRLPKYKDKEKGRNLLIYTIQAISKPGLRLGWAKLSMTNIKVPVLHNNICEVRIVPKLDHYVIEVVYEQAETQHDLNTDWYAAVDIGVDNLAALTSNKPGFTPVLVNGRPLKSINQYYNKHRAHLQSLLKHNRTSSKRIQRLSTQRNFKIDDYLHKASRLLINLLVAHKISTLIIGKNPLWKQNINMGKVNNQMFVSIPHDKWVKQLTYKATLVGIKVILTEESYTSKADFLMLDEIPVYGTEIAKKIKFSGRRTKTKLYRSGTDRLIHADVNASYNIMRKAIPTAFSLGIEGVVVRPIGVIAYKQNVGHI